MSDFFLPVVLTTPPDNPTVAAFQAVLNKAQQTCPWLPNLAGESAALIYADAQNPRWPRLNVAPEEGLDDGQQQQWAQIVKATAPITKAAMLGEFAQVKTQAAVLANNAAFWDTVYRITLDVATLGVNEAWVAFWEAIDACKQASAAIKADLDQAAQALADTGSDADPNDVAAQENLQGTHESLIQKILGIIAPLGDQVRSQAGLGIAPLVIAGITAATVVAITTSVWAVAHELVGVQTQANDHAQAVLEHQQAINDKLLADGQITPEQWQANNQQNVDMANSVTKNQGAGAVGSALGKAGMGVALGIGALALGAVALMYFMKKKPGAAAAPAVATNPRRRRR